MPIDSFLSKISKLSIITRVALGVVVFITIVILTASFMLLKLQYSTLVSILDKNRIDTESFIVKKRDENLEMLKKSTQFNAKMMANISSTMLYNIDNVALEISLRPFLGIQEISGIMVLDMLSTVPFVMIWKDKEKIESAFGIETKNTTFPLNEQYIDEDIFYNGKLIGKLLVFYSSNEIIKKSEELKKQMLDELDSFEASIKDKLYSLLITQSIGILILVILLIVVLILAFNKLEQKIQERTKELENKNEALTETLKQLQATQQQLVETEKMAALGGLVAGVAHEINTPVGIGITAISHLQEKIENIKELYTQNKMKRSDLERFLEISTQSSSIILSNLNRAAELIQSFKQVAVDQSSEEKRQFNLKRYINEILLSLRPKLKNTKHKVILECDENIELNTYAGALSQIFTNLIVNSLIHAFSDDKEGTIKIEVLDDKKDRVTIIYSDDGKGIAPENLKKIFEPFFTTKRGQGGSGLGLHIIYNIVTQKMGGTIVCESELDKGTRFIIDIPKNA